MGEELGAEGSVDGAQSLQESINELWKGAFKPVLHDDDALVLHSALEDNLSLITNDKRFAKLGFGAAAVDGVHVIEVGRVDSRRDYVSCRRRRGVGGSGCVDSVGEGG
ncbi:MAG TPA: hypothetical protein VHW44_33260 [Pseudonocardiaceae bacterium]|nr:hypothetical protein [Pseudonocardiaceae bacterium]